MGIIFYLAAECGPDQEAVQRFTKHFDGLVLAVPSVPKTSCAVDETKDSDGNWCGLVFPLGVGFGAWGEEIPELHTKARMSEIGWLLYEHLRKAPSFLYAEVGVDVACSELTYILESDLTNRHGFVVAESVLKLMGNPVSFVPFAPGYYWNPYEGESVGLVPD